MAKDIGLEEMDFLDIGGGFTMLDESNMQKNFTDVAPKIAQLIDELFPEPHIRIVGEPGRYIVESSVYLVSSIIGQKEKKNGEKHYYINNGIYQGYTVRIHGED